MEGSRSCEDRDVLKSVHTLAKGLKTVPNVHTLNDCR